MGVAIFKLKVWHPVAKHGAPARRTSNILGIKIVGFIAKPTIFCVIARPQRGRGNLKVEGMASRGEAREHEARGKPYHKKMGFAASFRFLALPSKALFHSVQP